MSEHRLLGLPVFLLYGEVATALDLVLAAGISRVAPGDGFVVFASVFIAFAVVAVACSDWILQRATRRRDKEAV